MFIFRGFGALKVFRNSLLGASRIFSHIPKILRAIIVSRITCISLALGIFRNNLALGIFSNSLALEIFGNNL